MIPLGYFDEDLLIIESCKNKRVGCLKELLRLSMRLSGAEYVKKGELGGGGAEMKRSLKSEMSAVGKYLEPIMPRKFADRLFLYLGLAVPALYAHATITMLYAEYLFMVQDKASKQMGAFVRPGGRAANGLCALRADILFANPQARLIFESFSERLRRLGAILGNLHSIKVITTGIYGSSAIIYYLITMLVLKYASPFRIDCMEIIFDPLRERKQLKLELADVVLDLLRRLAKDTHLDSIKFELCVVEVDRKLFKSELDRIEEHLGAVKMKALGYDKMPRIEVIGRQLDRARTDKKEPRRCSYYKDGLSIVKTLVELFNADKLQPFVCKAEAHDKLVSIVYIFMICDFLFAYIMPLITTLVLMFLDIGEVVKYRLGDIGCQLLLGQNGSLIEKTMKLPDMEPADLRVYKEYLSARNSSGLLKQSWDFVDLLSRVEMKYYMSWEVFLYTLQYHIMVFVVSVWAYFNIEMFSSNTMLKILWIEQIEEQLRASQKLLANQEQFSALSGGARKRAQTVRNRSTSTPFLLSEGPANLTSYQERQQEEFIKAVSMCYINYQLYRKTYHNFQEVGNYLLGQYCIFTLNATVLCYIIIARLQDHQVLFIMYCAIAMLITMNIYLIFGSWLLKKNIRLMRGIFSLIAQLSTNGSFFHNFIASQWQKELLSEHDLARFFGIHFFGVHVSYEQVITVNSYLGILIVFLLK